MTEWMNVSGSTMTAVGALCAIPAIRGLRRWRITAADGTDVSAATEEKLIKGWGYAAVILAASGEVLQALSTVY